MDNLNWSWFCLYTTINTTLALIIFIIVSYLQNTSSVFLVVIFFFALCASESALNRETDWFFCLLFSSLFPRLRHWKCLWNFYGDVGHHADDCLVFEVFSSKTKLISSPLGLDWRVGCLYCISTQYYYTTYILYYRDVVRCPLPACPCRLRMFILNCTKNQSP